MSVSALEVIPLPAVPLPEEIPLPVVPVQEANALAVVPVPVGARVKACRITHSEEHKLGMWEWQIETPNNGSEWVTDDECAEEMLVSKFCKTNNVRTIYIVVRDYPVQPDMIEIRRTNTNHLFNTFDAVHPKIRNGERFRIRTETFIPNILKSPTILMSKLLATINSGDEIRFTSFDCFSTNGKTAFNTIKNFENLGVDIIYVPLDQNVLFSNKTNSSAFLFEFRKYFAERMKGGCVGREYPVGAIPFGYVPIREDGKRKLAIHSEETVLIHYIISMYCTGKHTFETIANFLNSKNHLKKGKIWTKGSVCAVIKSAGESGFPH